MKTQISLEVKTPCTENFNSFQKTAKGGFCNSCSKEVIDFSKLTSQEIISYFKKNTGAKTCGKFNKNQFENLSNKNTLNKKLSFFSGIGLACLSLFTFGSIQAQQKPISKQIKQLAEDKIIKGIVSDETEALPGVSILLQGTRIGTETDFDGKFTFPKKLKNGDVLIFSYLGYETKKVAINSKNSKENIVLNVKFDSESCVLMGAVDVRQVYKSKKKILI
ncbi:MAG: carboxypeptidase-like regulatory domain-containing protein [Polaribacter sp.]|uniref:carboxypeptidase-like regulatory domain-containing protein n=1 Tax=Polaribacter sp. TaxID=1920175 RepID=UPI002F35DAC0